VKKLFGLLLLLAPLLFQAQNSYEKDLEEHRAEINREFADSAETILKKADVADFEGLDFFDAAPSFKVKAKFKRIKKGKVTGFATSTERIAKYKPYGTLTFYIDGKKCRLTVYEDVTPSEEYPDHLFLPFKDLSNGDSTYGGGRYLDLSKSDMDKEVELDFNYCYNPYCAYSNRYSCPVPPERNHLKVKIEAGVKAYAKGH